MNILNTILIFLIVIILLITIILYLGIQISLKFNKTGPELDYDLKILILNKINLLKKKTSKEKKFDFKSFVPQIKEAKTDISDFLKKAMDAFEIKKLKAHIQLGLYSYCDTAEYVGYLWNIFLIPNTIIKNSQLTAEPVFTQEIFDFNGEINVKINGLKLILPLFSLIRKKEIIRLIKTYRKGD